MEAELKSVKSMLRSVLLSSKEGVQAARLQRDYKDIVGDFMPFKKLGYQTFEQFILSIPDVTRLERKGGEVIIHGVADESTSHIKDMVSKQRSRKLKKPVRRPRGGGFASTKFLTRSFAPRTPGAYRPRHQETPGQHVPRHGIPSFISPPFVKPLTPVTISIRNNASGTRTIKLGSNPILQRAMSDANNDRVINRPPPQSHASKFEVPPRFRKIMGESSEEQPVHTTPVRGPSRHQPEPATLQDGERYIDILSHHLREINEVLQFDTTALSWGYVSSVKVKLDTFGSGDIFRAANEAEAAAARTAITELRLKNQLTESHLTLLDWNENGQYSPVLNWADEMSHADAESSSLPQEQLVKIKSRIKEILRTKKNGLWGTRIPHEYKEKYKEDAPAHLMELLNNWTDIAKIELIANTDRAIVFPVQDDPNRVSGSKMQHNATIKANGGVKQNSLQNSAVAAVKQNSVAKSAVTSPSKSGVKDLYGLYVETKDKQFSLLKNLEIARENLMSLSEEVTVYMTYIYNPGYFCVQREDSVIDDITEGLQTHCKSMSCPPVHQLESGRYCAAVYSGDSNWTRAQILQQKDNGMVELLFIDYGNVECAKVEDVRWLSPDLVKHPYQAINCSLSGIQPLEGDKNWCAAASELFADKVQEQALIAVPQAIYDNMIDVVLYLKSDTNESINEMLLRAGVVLPTEVLLEDDILHPADLVLPEEKEWDVHVTFISSTTESVMLRLVGEDFSDKLDNYQAKLQEAFRNSRSETPIKEGLTYIAYDDELYHRVRVISQEGNKSQCYFLDHGDTDELLPEQLHPIDPQINKLLPYQAVEVSLYGLEDVSNNITALNKICDLALGKTCVAEVIDREALPSVVLFDTSADSDLNINETILRTIEAEGGGIGTPSTTSPSPGVSASSTPQRVLSPVPSTDHVPSSTMASLETGTCKVNSNVIGDSKSVERLDTNSNSIGGTVQSEETITHNNLPTSQTFSANVSQNSELSTNLDTSLDSDLSMKSKSSDLLNTVSNMEQQNCSRPILGRSSNGKEVVDTLTNDNEFVPQPFQIPPVGEYLDVHVHCIHDPSNFICIPYDEMNNFNQLLLDMIDFYSGQLQPMVKSDIEPGKLYAGHKDGVWYRVKVSALVGIDLVSVYVVDIGEYTVMSEIQPLVQQFRKMPLMAINATLGSILPESGSWLESAKYKFIELAREKDLVALIQGQDKNTGIVDLRLIDTSKHYFDVCIDEVLVKMEYAKLK